MYTHNKYPRARDPHLRNRHRGGRLAIGAAVAANALSLASGLNSETQAAAPVERGQGTQPELQNTKPEKKQLLKPTATAIYGYGEEAVRVPLKLTYKKGVLRAHDVQRDEEGTRVEQHFSWSDNSQTARYRVKVTAKEPTLDTWSTNMTAQYKLNGRWESLYDPGMGSSSYTFDPVDYKFGRERTTLLPEQQAIAAAADVVRWTPYNTYGRMSIILPNKHPSAIASQE